MSNEENGKNHQLGFNAKSSSAFVSEFMGQSECERVMESDQHERFHFDDGNEGRDIVNLGDGKKKDNTPGSSTDHNCGHSREGDEENSNTKKFASFLLRHYWILLILTIWGIFSVFVGLSALEDLTNRDLLGSAFGFSDGNRKCYEGIMSLNVQSMDKVLTKSNMGAGINRKHFYTYFERDNNAALLVYVDKDEEKGSLIEESSLKDIFMVISYFQNMKTESGAEWKAMCKRFSLPMIGRSCLVAGFFNKNYIEFASSISEEMRLLTPATVYETMWQKNEGDLFRFFKNEVDFIPNIFYYPHTFDEKTSEKVLGGETIQEKYKNKMDNARVSTLLNNIEALVFVFAFDNDADDKALERWYKKMNEGVAEINNKKNISVVFNDKNYQKDYMFKTNDKWKIAVHNDAVLIENEVLKLHEDKHFFLMYQLCSFTLLCIFIVYVAKGAGICRTLEYIYAVVSYIFFTFCFSFYFYFISKSEYLRIFMFHANIVLYLCFLLNFVNTFYYYKCKEECNHFITTSSDCVHNENSGNRSRLIRCLDENDCFYSFYVKASVLSITFAFKFLFVLLLFCLFGFVFFYDIVRSFFVGLAVNICVLFFVHVFYFNTCFCHIFYNKNPVFENIKKKGGNKWEMNMRDGLDQQEKNISTDEVTNNNDGEVILNILQQTSNNLCHVDKISLGESVVTNEKNNQKSKKRKAEIEKKTLRFAWKIGSIIICWVIYYFLMLFFFAYYYDPEINIYKYVSTESAQYEFLHVLEKKAGYVAEPIYLVLPSEAQFNYAIQENRKKILQLVKELKRKNLVHEPIHSWIELYELYRNECSVIKHFTDTYEFYKYPKQCKTLVHSDDNNNVNELKDIFCEENEPCATFNDMIYHWTNNKPFSVEDEEFYAKIFQIKKKTNTTDINDVFPKYRAVPPPMLKDNGHINMTNTGFINSTRISFMFHHYINDGKKNINTVQQLEKTLNKYKIKGAYFYSESFALYHQVFSLPHLFYLEFFFNFIFIFILLVTFPNWNIEYFFPFWLSSHLTVLFCIHLFSVNTDAIFFIIFKSISLISAGHYIYTAMLKSNDGKKNCEDICSNLLFMMYFIYLAPVIFFCCNTSYLGFLVFLMMLNHIIWYTLSFWSFYLSSMRAYRKSVAPK